MWKRLIQNLRGWSLSRKRKWKRFLPQQRRLYPTRRWEARAHESKAYICYSWKFLLFCFVSFLFVGFLIPIFYPLWLVTCTCSSQLFCRVLSKRSGYAIKIIIACLSLYTGIVFGWLNVSSEYDAFLSIPIIASYYTLHVVFGIAVSLIGTTVRDYSNYIIDVSVRLVKKIKQIIEKRSSKI